MTTNNSKLLIALTKDTFITATKSKILDPTFSSTSELSITNIKTKDTTTHQCKSKFDHLFTFDSLTLGISENNTAEIYTDKLVATHEITSPFAFAYNPHKKLLAISNPLKLINTVDYKANICNFKHSFECLSWNNKVNHILASIADNRIIILDLKNKKEVVNVPLENFKLSQANTIMWHWSELTSLIIGTKNGTYKINLSDGTASKISNYGEKVIFSDYLVCTDYKTVEFYDKDLNLVLSKEMNICDIDVNEENVAISYMDRKPEIMKKSRFVERYGGKKQKNLFYIDNKNVISLNEKYRVKNEIYEETSEPENLLIITSAMEGKDIDLEEYLVKKEDKEQSLKLATIRKILDKECFSDEEYKSMDNSLVLLLSEYGNDFKYIAENIEIEKWANLVDTINKSNNNSKKLYYGILRERLEEKGMKKEAMIVCVFAQDFAKLYKMQIDLLVLPKCVEEINPFYAKFRCIVEKFKALNVNLENEIYTSFLKWEEYNKNGSIENDLLKMKIDNKQAKPVGAVKQNMYNNANYNTYQKPNVYKPQTRNEEPVNKSIPQMPNRPSFGNLQQKGSPQQSSMSYAQQNNVRPNIPFANTARPSQPNMQTSPVQQSNTRTYPAQANTPQQNNVYQPGKALNANNLIPSFSPAENVQPAKPKMTYGDINKQQVKNVMGRPGLQMPTSNLRSPTTSQRPMQGVVPPIPTPRQPSADSSVMSQRPAQSAIPSPSLRPPQMAKAPVSAPEFSVNPQKPMPSVRQSQNVNPPQTNNQQAGNAQNLLSETQKQEMMNGIQKKINFLITESSKKNGFFHKNKITSSMKRLQFYEINKEGFSDSLIINLHELLSMIDEEECTNMLDKFKAKTSEMNSAFGNSCGFDVFGLGLLGLYQVVLSEKK